MLPAAALQRALANGNVDHRHCIEKTDLAVKLRDSNAHLPLSVRSDITALVQAPKTDLALQEDVHHALLARVSRLQLDEQYSVRLFQVRRKPPPGACRAMQLYTIEACTHV